ncbi:hypothetical protein ADINL_2000 [Nitrincola lacisaponensis]|uniref:Flagellar Assembly Protein A N-terminal region domain-containing protein n=1 Tax=Nitrincola lacisaponensis TaxID=267850 RepID=A0A063Y469_9GAMM|nr:FapA family protein [Nitrincola lacisaponensis]KDE39546.1 hypothetical protein ADINL_2000 [Nitrincola lacisaponensis]
MSSLAAEPSQDNTAANQSLVSAVLFTFDPDTRSVLATLESSPAAHKIDLPMLQALLDAQGYGAFYTSHSAIDELILQASQGNACSKVIAYQRDAELEWMVNPDKMAVYLTVLPSCGGKAITRDWLIEELQAQGIDETCVDQAALDQVLTVGQAERLCVARGIEPVSGLNSRFEVLVEGCKKLLPGYSEEEQVDFHQVQDFIVVERGEVLMQRLPPTAGVPGLTVLGEVLPAEPGEVLEFNTDVEGAIVDPDNPDQLVATVKGHPVLLGNGVFVDPTLRIDSINLESGNIDFDGSVEVKGDVTSGFSLKATGDIVIRGMVEKATVIAGRNLTVVGGVAGEDLGRDQNNELILKARLRAGGNIRAKYTNLAYLRAGGDIIVREFVLQSHLSAKGGVYLTQPGSKGCIIGGKILARSEIVANCLGSDANVPTQVRVGRVNCKRKLEEQLQTEYSNCLANCEKLEKVLASSESPEHKTSINEQLSLKIKATRQAYVQKAERIKAVQARLNGRKQTHCDATVTVKIMIYPNVCIAIDGATYHNRACKGGCYLVREGLEVVSR